MSRFRLVMKSRNRKTGKIPVSMSSRDTCPSSCPWYDNGCYAEQHLCGLQWRRLERGEGLTWPEFLQAVRKIPAGQVWRHNEAGDLPGDGLAIDLDMLQQLAKAAEHTRGFTYTHKPMTAENRAALLAKGPGLVVNLSADGVEHADTLFDLGIAPVAVVLPAGWRRTHTPRGRRVVLCPATTTKGVTCATCKLCAVPTRKSIVGFPAHGCARRKVTTELVQLRLPL